jgi:O-antigen/teichoic acid export membrane protein
MAKLACPSTFTNVAILITFLLILSFMGMTFQIVLDKYAVLFKENKSSVFINSIAKYAVLTVVFIGVLVLVFNRELQFLFHTKTATVFVIFSFGIPLCFLMSINRGLYQGQNRINKLAFTYQTEMASEYYLPLPPFYYFLMFQLV